MVLAASAASEAAPGVLGFLVVAGMGLILYFLFRSMAKHLRRVNNAARQDAAGAPPDSSMVSSTPQDPSGPR